MPETKRVFCSGPEGVAVEEQPEASAADPDLTERTVREMNFSTHVISLNAMGLMQLGELGDGPVDLPGAQHVVDTLSMLKEKTQGNLTSEEARLLDTVLYDLRMKYVEKT